MKLFSFASALALFGLASAFELKISDQDDYRQACSGMWGGDKAYIKVTFDPASRGQVAMVIYEWRDARYLGIDTEPDNYAVPKTYVCTTDAVRAKLCSESQLGRFILNLKGASHEEISIWSASVGFGNTTNSGNTTVGTSGFWDNPAGNPTPPPSEWDSPWRRGVALSPSPRHVNNTVVPTGVLWYKDPILYQVDTKGYYCVAAIPITTGATADTAVHAEFKGHVLYHNVFHGKLAATDYPKINFYMVLALVYLVLGGVWGFMCFRHRDDLLPLQFYISYLVGFLVIEMTATWAYYRYLNSHDRGTATTLFLAVVAILDAGRNALSFFLLLVVSLGLSVVRESLGPIMTRVKLLAGAHFVFGVLYAMGMVELELESASALLLLMFVIPLSFTLSGFLLWIMYALNGTMAELADRKQTYKLGMFRTLYRILLLAVIIIGAFFVVSSMSFSNRLDEDYAPETWETRWYLLDAWLAILYLAVFTSIAFLWRPTGHNRRLAMSDELAQDDDAAGEYDLESIRPDGMGGPSEEHLPGAREPLRQEEVVFEIGDDDEEEGGGRRRGGEREGLMGDGRVKDRRSSRPSDLIRFALLLSLGYEMDEWNEKGRGIKPEATSHVSSSTMSDSGKPLRELERAESIDDELEIMPAVDPELEKKLVRKLDGVIIPLTCALYLFAFLDRSNLGNARLQGLPEDVLQGDPTGAKFDWVSSMFYFSYILAQLPAVVTSKLFRPRIWIGCATIGWGLASTLQAAAFNFQGLLAARFFLGIFEAGFGPMVPLYYTFFYTKHEMGVRLAVWFGFAAVAGAFGGLIAYGVQHVHSYIANWRILFLGCPTIALGILTLFTLPDRPDMTKWLQGAQKDLAIERMSRGGTKEEAGTINKNHVFAALKDWRVYAGGVIYFGVNIALASIGVFLPTIIKSFGYTNARAQLLTVPPYAVAAVVMMAVSYISDRTQNRGLFMASASAIGGLGYL
ncbi:unnamed protein product [Rhizoctonia solani]|uniref:Major facilitator superfamily (MFS) profile domain-containing protein n=1 Tax=Rhizoctonia solani TaxID=456999 RepID=A0A8H3B7B9_9AGAM|nr:unnamed protein product [Rhizoctonia solani]